MPLFRACPAGFGRDVAVEKFSWAIKDKDPTTAIAWAATLSDPTRRVSQVEGLARNWLAYDPPAARLWIASTDALSDQAKHALLRPR